MVIDQRGDGGEQRGMRERQRGDAVVLGGVPGFGDILERDLPLFALRPRATWSRPDASIVLLFSFMMMALACRRDGRAPDVDKRLICTD